MTTWTTRLAPLLVTAALLAGCGSSSKHSSAQTTASAPASTATTTAATTSTAAATTTATASTTTTGASSSTGSTGTSATGTSTSAGGSYPQTIVASFVNKCKSSAQSSLTGIPPKFRPKVNKDIGSYCSCALDNIEHAVGAKQFTTDMEAVASGQAKLPKYLQTSEKTCGVKLRHQFQQLIKG